MATNYFIGIGGTGARVAEALVHLCGAGMGPGSLNLFLVDPDKNNGNLNRTKRAIRSYRSASNVLRRRDADALLETDIKTPDPFVSDVLKQDGRRLEDHINHASLRNKNPALADLAEVLFSEEEMSEELSEGFRGHPSIGATVMASTDDSTDPWKTFREDLEKSGSGEPANVFLAGSVFGGTGAAGLPTFGAPDMIKGEGETDRARLGAALVLPYFSFDVEDHDRLFVTSGDFPAATKDALQFYSEKELAFDETYLIGDSLRQNVGDFSPGSRSQENRPHYIELASALAARDFFQSANGEVPVEKKRFIAARPTETISWSSFPVSRKSNADGRESQRLKRRMTTMTAFAYGLLDFGIPRLHQSTIPLDYWYREHFQPGLSLFGSGSGPKPRDPDERKKIEEVGAYAQQFLRWITGLDLGEGDNVKLIERGRLVGRENGREGQGPQGGNGPDNASPQGSALENGLPLKDHMTHGRSIGSFLPSDEGKERRFCHFVRALNRTNVEAEGDAAERFVRLFYRGAEDFCLSAFDLIGSRRA